MRAKDEYQGNQINKRAIVVDRDPAKHRVKVQFLDEDENLSNWIDVGANSATGSSAFMMPGLGDEVWCAMDSKGEDGCVICSKYNDKDASPYSSNDDVGLVGSWGSIHVNIASGDISIETSGNVKITANNIAFESATLTHNGVNVGDDHKHKDVLVGGAISGVPI